MRLIPRFQGGTGMDVFGTIFDSACKVREAARAATNRRTMGGRAMGLLVRHESFTSLGLVMNLISVLDCIRHVCRASYVSTAVPWTRGDQSREREPLLGSCTCSMCHGNSRWEMSSRAAKPQKPYLGSPSGLVINNKLHLSDASWNTRFRSTDVAVCAPRDPALSLLWVFFSTRICQPDEVLDFLEVPKESIHPSV